MATGYTSVIKDGISARKFILRCARAFDACVMQRDEAVDVLPPKAVEASDYHQRRLEEGVEEYMKLRSMSQVDLEEAAGEARDEAVASNKRRVAETEDLGSKYEAMLDAVKEWQPPSEEHEPLRKFMVEQIQMSVEHDCNVCESDTTLLTAREWFVKERDRICRDIGYHCKENEAEKKRADERTEWLEQLWNSLPNETT